MNWQCEWELKVSEAENNCEDRRRRKKQTTRENTRCQQEEEKTAGQGSGLLQSAFTEGGAGAVFCGARAEFSNTFPPGKLKTETKRRQWKTESLDGVNMRAAAAAEP